RSTRPVSPASVIPEPSRVAERADAEAREVREPLRELTLGRAATPRKVINPPPSAGSVPKDPAEELTPIEARCRWKAEAARRAVHGQRRLRQGEGPHEEDAPAQPEIAEWADRWTDAYYW